MISGCTICKRILKNVEKYSWIEVLCCENANLDMYGNFRVFDDQNCILTDIELIITGNVKFRLTLYTILGQDIG